MSLRWTLIALAVVMVGALAFAASMPATALNLLASLGGGTRLVDQRYGPLPRQRFDVYGPGASVPRPPGGFPLVVFFYGGSWNSGERADYRFVGQPLAHARQHAVPTFLGAALSDTVVNPTRNTQALANALAAGGTAVTLKLYERTNHLSLIGAMAWPLRWLAPVLDDVAAFVAAQPATP